MSRIRSVLGVAIVALVFGTLVSGADKPSKSKNYTPSGWAKLSLTPEQRLKINQIHTDYKKQIDDLNKQLEALKDKRQSDMLAVLTKKQKEKLAGLDTESKDKKENTSAKDKK
jgi:Spy/CpxP family protein refolding chaperone